MQNNFYYLLLLFILTSCSNLQKDTISFASQNLEISLDNRGYITAFIDQASGQNYLATDTLAPFLSIRKNGTVIFPERAAYTQSNQTLSIQFPENTTASILVREKETHLSFELDSLQSSDHIEMIIWGPYPTTIHKTIGETIGVVQGESFTLGIQALNPKTLGGYPWNDNDCMPQIDIFESGDFPDLNEKGKRHVLYRVEAAKPEAFGSTLQAYCRNRDKVRVTSNWNHEKYTIPTYDDGGVIGSKIALFGCPVEETLTTLEQIELAEDLPHPTIDGQWGKTARSANAAYLILGFGEKDIDKAISYTKQAGLRHLYHPGPFKNWGRFDLNEQFPSGWDGLKLAVERAKAEDLYVGVHTLSNFITTDDPYVTPVPDSRLGKVGSTLLNESINATQTKIRIAEPDFFNQYQNNHLKTVQIGNELIRYGQVSEDYGFVCNYKVLEDNGYTNDILAAIGHWEEARMTNVFSEEQKIRMKDIAREFRLEKISNNNWKLLEFSSDKFQHEAKIRQPGEHQLQVDGSFSNTGEQAMLKVELRLISTMEEVK